MKRETHVTMLLGYQLAGCELLVAFDRLFSNCASKRMPSSFLKIWVFPKIGVPQNGWFVMENPIKMDDLGVPLFLETPISQISQKGHIFLLEAGVCFCGEISFFFYGSRTIFLGRNHRKLVPHLGITRKIPFCYKTFTSKIALLNHCNRRSLKVDIPGKPIRKPRNTLIGTMRS